MTDNTGKLLLRIAIGGLMLFHGIWKLTHGIGWLFPMLEHHGLPGFLAYGVYLAEIVAPILILLGVATRMAALVVGFDMLMAIFLVLRQQIFAVKESGGGWGIELEAFYLLASLALAYLGAGAHSLVRKRAWWN